MRKNGVLDYAQEVQVCLVLILLNLCYNVIRAILLRCYLICIIWNKGVYKVTTCCVCWIC